MKCFRCGFTGIPRVSHDCDCVAIRANKDRSSPARLSRPARMRERRNALEWRRKAAARFALLASKPTNPDLTVSPSRRSPTAKPQHVPVKPYSSPREIGRVRSAPITGALVSIYGEKRTTMRIQTASGVTPDKACHGRIVRIRMNSRGIREFHKFCIHKGIVIAPIGHNPHELERRQDKVLSPSDEQRDKENRGESWCEWWTCYGVAPALEALKRHYSVMEFHVPVDGAVMNPMGQGQTKLA